ncbi:anillin, actin binding protein 2 isoform X4 [Gouania willdenowi]|uniref:Anillin-like n=1 Tax=Gouania willdenowi TaxID=441366 RepID=A0A8C5DNC9_GOUWI|nr:anillin-like isoform X4 [Gouania willdenowi]
MEGMEEKDGTIPLKRQREPLSDSDDVNFLAPEEPDGQKRRRLEATGQENRTPKTTFSSGRLLELQTKPDTPIVPSVHSRVLQLSQSIDGGFPSVSRCLSDPGGEDEIFREPLLSKREFNQRMERFKVPVVQDSPSSSPNNSRFCSDFVSAIQQKLQGSTTPSSKQESRMRQEREQELSLLHLQPITENAWLKRSTSDPSLNERWTPVLASLSSSWVPRTKRKFLWPPTKPWEQVSGDEEIKDDSFSEASTSGADSNVTDAELSSNETNAAEIIDQMFDEVLEYAEKMEDEQQDNEDTEERDSGIYTCSGDKVQAENNADKGRCEEKCQANTSECDERKAFESTSDELLGFPPTGILSPLSKSIESAVTPLRLAASQESNPPPLLQTPEESSEQPKESAPLYSIDAYRTQRQSKLRTIQSVTPGVQRRAAEMSIPQPSVNSKEKITALNDDSAKLQIVINQTLQALSCCTDEEHGRGSLEEAEAEKLLLVSCEKRSALLAEVTRLREQRSSESAEATEEHDYVSQQPCRGTVSITNIQLPLKVEFVCSSHNRPGRPSHYFFVLIRYGSCTVVATPLATAADAKNGDTISFPTVVTLKDIHSSFEIDVEVYSLDNTSGPHCSTDRASTKSRVTPRKLLNTLTRSSNTLTPVALPALKTRRSSNFCLVGSHKLTLASFGHNKFPLDKMKLEGKIRRLLGDEFQEKVPFLSPLEGNIYLQLDSVSHSNVLHQGFLTMFELVSGYGVWNRRYFLLEGCNMYYWNHPNDREIKEAEGCLSLFSFPSQCVRPVKRDSCARPFTFELVNNAPQLQQDNNQDGLAKCWFSADTKQDRLDWMEKLSQALLDFHTWNRTPMDSETSNMSTSGSLRESLL